MASRYLPPDGFAKELLIPSPEGLVEIEAALQSFIDNYAEQSPFLEGEPDFSILSSVQLLREALGQLRQQVHPSWPEAVLWRGWPWAVLSALSKLSVTVDKLAKRFQVGQDLIYGPVDKIEPLP